MPPAELSELILRRLRDVPDYPKAGVVFKDITPLLADASAFAEVVAAIAAPYRHEAIDAVIGIEARGFILAAPIAHALGAGFVPIRKSGKLPAATLRETYELEYGTETVEMHTDALEQGRRVLIVDDVLATGGTAAAAVNLVGKAGGSVVGAAFLLELGFLHGRSRLPGVTPQVLLTV